MIGVLRLGALLVNVAVVAGIPLGLGAPWWGAVAALLTAAWASWILCGRAPRGERAEPLVQEQVHLVCARMEVAAPSFIELIEGCSAAVVRRRGGYGLLLGRELKPEHLVPVTAHELAHVRYGDLVWEPFTDGPARLVLRLRRLVPPVVVAGVPFLVLGLPLARATELRADRAAAAAVPTYPAAIKELVADQQTGWLSLYPSPERRIASSARHSIGESS